MIPRADTDIFAPSQPDPLHRQARVTTVFLAFALVAIPFGYRIQWDITRAVPLVLLTPALWLGRELVTQRLSCILDSKSRLLLVVLVFLAATLLSIIGTVHWAASLTTACTWCLLGLTAVLVAELVKTFPATSRLLLGAMVVSVGLAASLHWFWWKNGRSSFYAFYSHPRLMGLHTLGGALAGVAMFLQAERRNERMLWFFLGILAWGALFWSGSRSALVGAAAGLLLWLVRARDRRRLNLVLACGALTIGGLLLSLAFWTDTVGLGWWHVARRTATTQSVQQITSNRSSFWSDAARHALASPWNGYGPDGYSFITPKLEGAQPHNLLLQLTLDVGAPGAAAALVLLAFCLWRGWRNPQPDAATTGWLALAGANLAAAQFDGYLYYPIASIPTFLALGACAGGNPMPCVSRGVQSSARPIGAWRWAAGCAATIVAVNCWLFHCAYHQPPPPRPDAFVARVWRAFPSVTYNIDNWIDAWAKNFPDEALATSLFARPRSQSPEIFRVKTAHLLARRGAFDLAVAELEHARTEVAPEHRATIEQLLRQLRSSELKR